MEESYETFEEELWPPRAEPPPEKPVRQIRRSEMHASRTVMEEGIPVQQPPRSEHKILPREPSFAKTSSLRKSFSIQNLTQIETPWENVTLNRCLFVAITILVLTSGCQRLHEAFCGEGKEEEEAALTRRSGTLRHRGQLPEPETSLWEVMFSWLPNLDDEDDDDDEKIKKGKSKREVTPRELRGLRNRRLPDKKLLKQKDEKLKDKRARKARDEEVKDKKGRVEKEDPEEAEDEKDEEDEQMAPKKIKLEEKKDKKKIKKG